MPSDFDSRLRALAEVVVRIGLNLQPGQPLLITDPYDLLGVHPEALPLATAIKAAAGAGTQIITADPARLRALAEANDQKGYVVQVAANTLRMRNHLKRGGAFLFLTGSAPQLFAGLPPDRLARFEAVKWRLLGPVIQKLIRGATQWTLLPAPTSDWATAAGTTVPALWETVFSALRLPPPSPYLPPPPSHLPPLEVWQSHLAALTVRCDELNAARHRRIRYTGTGTDLTLDLPRSHRWCTAQLTTPAGVPFVVNLPTEEVFTAPHRSSATGRVRIARPVAHNGTVMDDIELEFRSGRVVQARARTGEDHLQRLLAADNGACRIGEVALVENVGGALRPDAAPASALPPPPAWASSLPAFHHTILDENSAHHIALGDAYRFCSRAWLPLAINSSQLHLDLPLDAQVELL